MNKTIAIIALALCTSTFGETFTGLVVDLGGACVIAKPEDPKQTLANVMWNLKSEVVGFAGKVVTIEGKLHPEKAFPTLESIISIKEAQ